MCRRGILLIPFQPTVSVQLDNFIPLRNRPDSIGRHVRGRTLPVPCLYRNLPGLTIVGFDVFDGFTGHTKLCVYKLSPAQCKLGKQVPVAKQAMWRGVRLQQWKLAKEPTASVLWAKGQSSSTKQLWGTDTGDILLLIV